jgi:hypothetical protein
MSWEDIHIKLVWRLTLICFEIISFLADHRLWKAILLKNRLNRGLIYAGFLC